MKQTLTNQNKEVRKNFAEAFLQFLNNHQIKDSIWFSDEVHFLVQGYVNKLNMRIWATEQPHEVLEKPFHPKRVTVWCAFSAIGIIGPIFIDGTVTSANYHKLLSDEFVSILQGMELINQSWFQQDGARPHTANFILDFLNEHSTIASFRNVILRDMEWAFVGLHSLLILIHATFFLWGYLKDRVYPKQQMI